TVARAPGRSLTFLVTHRSVPAEFRVTIAYGRIWFCICKTGKEYNLLHRDGGMPDRHHAAHYLGSAVELELRPKEHESGGGARLAQVWVDPGCPFHCVRIWQGGRPLERRLKQQPVKERPGCGLNRDAADFDAPSPSSTGKRRAGGVMDDHYLPRKRRLVDVAH